MMADRLIDERVEFFRQNGYVLVPNALSPDEVRALNQAVSSDLEQYPRMWAKGSDGRVQNANVLLSCSALDQTIWQPTVLPLVEALLGPDLCFEELSVMLRGPWTDEAPVPEWHRDTGHLPERPFALRALSVIFYLTDVDAGTHCFSIVPEDVERKRQSPRDRDGTGGHYLHGAAGTAILFNAASCHAAIIRRTERERRTIHTYYGHATEPPLGEHTIVPRRLADAPDPARRRLFTRLNTISRLVLQNT